MLELLLLFADDPPKTPPTPGGLPPEMPFILLGGMVLLYFLVLRPMTKRQERERQNLLTNLKKNDKVLTSAGIYGTVVSVSDTEDEVTVKVDDNTRLRMLKGSIVRNISGEEALKTETKQDKK